MSGEERLKFLQQWNQLKNEIAIRGESAERRVRLANVQLKLKERKNAVASLQIALHLKPETPAILSKLKKICTDKEFERLELPVKTNSFWQNMPALLRYPLSGTCLQTIIAGAMFVTALQFVTNFERRISSPSDSWFHSILPIGFVITIVLLGFLCSYFASVVRASGQGETDPPGWPDVKHIIDIIRSMYVILLPGLVSFIPALAYFLYGRFFDAPPSVLIILIAVGAFYYPMPLIVSVVSGAPLDSLKFQVVSRSLLDMRIRYSIAGPIFVILALLSVAAHMVVSFFMVAMANTIIPAIILGIVFRALHLYFLMIYAHSLGLFYRQCRS